MNIYEYSKSYSTQQGELDKISLQLGYMRVYQVDLCWLEKKNSRTKLEIRMQMPQHFLSLSLPL